MLQFNFTKIIASDRLEFEIRSSAITKALDFITTEGAQVTIYFKSDLSPGEETLLSAIVASHVATPLPDNVVKPVSIDGTKLDGGRIIMADNRVPLGYTLYVSGEADNILTGAFGSGAPMKFDSANLVREFQLLTHVFIIGARTSWENCSIDNFFKATMIAPASSGFTLGVGDFVKVPLGGPYNKMKPVAAGTGTWAGTLNEKKPSTQILKATPVPTAGNLGWFDYDSDLNVLTPNLEQKGGYDLYDFDINLHSFARKVWASPSGQTDLDIAGLVGKKIFNTWKLKIEFAKDGGTIATERAAAFFIIATQKNI